MMSRGSVRRGGCWPTLCDGAGSILESERALSIGLIAGTYNRRCASDRRSRGESLPTRARGCPRPRRGNLDASLGTCAPSGRTVLSGSHFLAQDVAAAGPVGGLLRGLQIPASSIHSCWTTGMECQMEAPLQQGWAIPEYQQRRQSGRRQNPKYEEFAGDHVGVCWHGGDKGRAQLSVPLHGRRREAARAARLFERKLFTCRED